MPSLAPPTTDVSLSGPLDVSLSGSVAPPWPRRGRRLQVDAATLLHSVHTWVTDLIQDQDRGEFYARRLDRYAKYRGWVSEPKRSPWPGCSDVQFPMMQTAELRLNAGLHNVVMTMRPLASARAARPADQAKEDQITALVDAQVFVDPGPEVAERIWSDYIAGFTQDGPAVMFTPWVREEQAITEVFFRPPVPATTTADEYLLTMLEAIFQTRFAEGDVVQDPTIAHRYQVTVQDRGRPTEAVVEVFLADDDTVELVVKRPVTLYDGPVAQPVDLDDLFIPTRCTNLQPPSGWNPRGAPRLVLRDYLSLDAIRRNQRDGTFNWLDPKGLEAIETAARALMGEASPKPDDGDPLKEQGDRMEGRDHRQPSDDAALGQIVLPIWRVFDQWDVDGDDLLEDTYWVIVPDAGPEGTLCEARLLRERWPATRAYRPLAESHCLRVKGRWYSMGLLELGEKLQDLVKATFDMAFDAASIAKRPFFFYNSTAWKGQFEISLGPAEGYPVSGNPRDQILFPNIPAGDQAWAFQVIGLAVQAFERLLMLGDLQLGRVPQGKASALRTYGTTAALLQQGDVRADQMLLRLFGGISQVFLNFHRMNRHLLPPGKTLRKLGWDGPEAQAYLTLERGMADVDAEVAFEFRPDFLQSSQEARSEAIEGFLTLLITPLAVSMGVVDPILFYNALKDVAKARKLDYRRYLKPPTPEGGTPIFAKDAIDAIVSDRLPTGTVAAEGTAAHAKELFAFLNSDAFGLLTPAQTELFRAYLAQLGARHQREQLAQHAQHFQQQTGQGGGGGGSPGAPPALGTGPDAAGQPTMPMPGPPNANGGGG